MTVESRRGPQVSDVFKGSLGIAGLAMCITLVFLGMRSVMDVGGACADGGPYVSAQGCPDGATPALLLGMFGLFLFGGIAMVYGVRIGGIWAAVPLLAWSALFLSLGWNFLDYGVFNPPLDDGVVWGWAFCGVLFMIMGGLPLLVGLTAFGEAPLRAAFGTSRSSSRSSSGRTSTGTITLQPHPDADAEAVATFQRALAPAARSSLGRAAPASVVPPGATARREELRGIAADMSAVVTEATASTPADPLAREAAGVSAADNASAAADPQPPDDAAFTEGTQALLDRLERLADLRDRGLLAPDEYEAAKDAIVSELETRS